MKIKRVATIDVGTLKSKFEVSELENGAIKSIHKEKHLTTLGEGIIENNGNIQKSSVEKTIRTLLHFKKVMNSLGVIKHRAVTTEAIRKAKNSKEVLDKIHSATGIYLEEITQAEEARLYALSISKDFKDKTIAAVDIGGGSVQVILIKETEIIDIFKFKTGTYFLQQEYLKSHLPSNDDYKIVEKVIKESMRELRNVKEKVDYIVYGSSNIIEFFEYLKVEVVEHQKGSNHPVKTDVSKLFPLFRKISKIRYPERMPLYPKKPYFMWGVDKSLLNIFQISDYLNTKEIVPTNNNLSTGLTTQLFSELN